MSIRNNFRSWIKNVRAALRGEKRAPQFRKARPQTELLEDRLAPAITPITVLNPSFEAPVQLSNGFTNADITNWTSPNNTGVFYPDSPTYYNVPVPDGNQVAYSNAGLGTPISQVLSTNAAQNTVYRLDVEIGSRSDNPSPGYSVTLLEGVNTLGSVTQANFPVVNGNFVTATVFATKTTASTDPLQIQLASNGVQTNFDNVRLVAMSLTIDGTGGDDDIQLFRNGGNIQVTVNGNLAFDAPVANVPFLNINGLGGSDTLTVDFTNGDPVPAGGVSYDGGTGLSDAMVVTGYNVPNVTVTHTAVDTGTVQIGAGAPLISFTGLEPLALGGTAANLIINLPAGPNPDVLLADDTAANFPGHGTGAANTSAIDGSTFEYTQFTNPTATLTVNLGNAGDTLTLAVLDGAWAANTTLNGGNGADTFNIQATPGGVTTRVNAGPGVDTVNVSSNAPTNTGTLDDINGLLEVNSGDIFPNGDVLNISATGQVNPDTVLVNTGLSPFEISGTAGGGWTIRDVSTFFSGGINLLLGSGGNTVNVQSTFTNEPVFINTGTGVDTVNVSSNAPTNTGDLNNLNSILTLNSGNTNGGDVLNISESGVLGGDITIDLDAQISAFREVTGTAGGGWTVRKSVNNFGGGVNVFAGTGANTIYVPSTQAGEALSVASGAGDDTIVLGAGPTNLPRDLDFIQGNVSIAGNAHGLGDTLELRDDNDNKANSYTVTAGSVVRPGAANITFNTIENLSIFAGIFADAFDITPFAGTVINANGNQPPFPTQPGDTLLYRGDGTKTISSAPGSGTISAPGVGDVHFSSIEEVSTPPGNFLNDVIDLTLLPGGQDGNPNQVVLQRDASGLWFQILIDFNTNDNGGIPNPVLFSQQLYASIGMVTVIGGTDDDEVVVNNANGLINRTIDYSGGTGFNALAITGDPGTVAARTTFLAADPTVNPSDNFAGTWVVDPTDFYGPGAVGAAAQGTGQNALVVNFTQLSPVDDDTPAAIFDAILSAAADLATITDGGLLSGFASLQVTSNSATFEDFRFTRKDLARIMGNSGADGFRINYSTAPAGSDGVTPMPELQVYGHLAPDVLLPVDDNAIDTFELDATAAIITSLFGDGGSDVFHNIGIGPFFTGPNNMSSLLGTINIDGGTGANDAIRLQDFLNNVVARNATLTNTQLTGAAPATINYTAIDTFLYEASALADTIDVLSTQLGTYYYLTGDGDGDTITIGNTTANFLANTFTGDLTAILGEIMVFPEFNPLSPGAVDTLNIDASGNLALAGAASIDVVAAYVGPVIPPGVADSGPATELLGFAPAAIRYRHTDSSFVPAAYNNRLEFLNVRASQGDDVIFVGATSATNTTTLDTREGNDTVTILGNNLSANNLFQGNEGNDDFILNIVGFGNSIGQTPARGFIGSMPALFAIASLQIEGNDPAADSANRDRLTVNDSSTIGRALDYFYMNTQGDLNIATNPLFPISGLFGANIPNGVVTVRSMETYIFNDIGDNNDLVRVFGATDDGTLGGANPANDVITVGLLDNNTSALVFLNGQPYTEVPPVPLINPGNLPGVSGGGLGTDLLLRGLDAGFGLRLDGNGNPGALNDGDRAIVYARSEDDLVDAAAQAALYDIFGFGAGVLQPGTGVGNAYDTITVTDFVVATTNNAFGPLTTVFLNTLSFVQVAPPSSTQQAALIVNGGDEVGFQPNNIADAIVAFISSFFNIQINGNEPGLTFAPPGGKLAERQGDQLTIVAPSGALNIFSDGASPVPNVMVTSTATGPFGIRNSSIERLNLDAAANGIVNVIGDNNDPNVTQNDYVRVIGRDVDGDGQGYEEFQIELSGNWDPVAGTADFSAPIYVNNVRRLNVLGGNAIGFDPFGNAIAEENNTGTDALEITPYADNTPLGWGVETYYNEGDDGVAPSGEPVPDLLIYNGVLGVSENIVVQPSAPEAGQVFSNNAASNTPIAIINYALNSHIIINGSSPAGTAGDTDTLTLRGTDPSSPGTSGLDDVFVNLTAAGTALDPLVQVTDNLSGLDLYFIQNFTNFSTLNIETLGGSDFISIIGRDDGSVTINVDGGAPSGVGGPLDVDTVELVGVANADDAFLLVAGLTADSGRAEVVRDGAVAATLVNFTRIERVNTDGGGGTGTDVLTVNGTAGNDVFTLTGTAPLAGNISTSFGPQIDFFSFGTTSSDINLNGLAGDDAFIVNHVANWQIGNVNIDGGSPSASDTVHINGTTGDDEFTYTPTSINSATLDLLSGGSTTTYTMTDVEALSANGGAPFVPPGDLLTIALGADHAFITPGTNPGEGRVDAIDAVGGNALLPLIYASMERLEVSGDTAVILGTSADDTITLSAAGLLRVTNLLGFDNTIDVSGFNSLVINGLGGNDNITIEPSALFAGGIRVIGSAGSDRLTVSGATPTIDLVGNTISGIVGGNITTTGVETVTTNATGATTLNNYGSPTDIATLNLNAGTEIDVGMAGGTHTIDYRPTGVGSGQLGIVGGPIVNVAGLAGGLQDLQVNALGSILGAVFHGTAGSDAITAQAIAGTTNLSVAGLLAIDLVGAASAQVLSGDGDDVLTVNEAGGLLNLPGGLTFDGGNGSDTLLLVGPGPVTATYNVGPDAGSGWITHDTQTVYFHNLEPVIDLVAGTLTVNGTNASNAINYTLSNLDLTWGKVSIDGFEAIHFSNKTTLTIDGQAGSDTINLDALGVPNGLTGITVNGGDPTSGDQLIVNGLFGGSIVDFAPVAYDQGSISVAGLPLTNYQRIESVLYVGRSGGDLVTVTSPLGGAEITFVPGATMDSGTVTQVGFNQASELTPFEFRAIGTGAFLNFVTAGGARSSGLNIHGTAADNAFDVNAAGTVRLTNVDFPAPLAPTINTPGVTVLRLLGLDGNDVFNIEGNHPFTTGIVVEGGSPSASDVLNFTTLVAGNITVDLAGRTVTQAGFTPVSFSGIEHLNVVDVFGGNNITVVGTAAGDQFAVTPTGPNTATITRAGSNLTITTDNTGTLTIDGALNVDTATVHGTDNADVINVDRTAGTVEVVGRKIVTLTSIEALVIAAGLGADTINVTGSGGPAVLSVDGGSDATSDTLTVTTTANLTTTVTPGSTPDSGSVSNTDGTVNFVGIEALTINGQAGAGDALVILGTHDNDTFALQRLGGANRVWLNNRAVVTFNDAIETITLNGRFGSDAFSVHPATLVGVTTVNVIGGDPTASDSVVITGTAGPDAVNVTPTASDAATITGLGPVVNLTTVEHLTYNGLGGGDTLTFTGTGGGDSIVHTPGATADSGALRNNSLLGLTYTNLGAAGSVTVDGLGGLDTLTYLGSNQSGDFNVDAAGAVIYTDAVTHVTLNPLSIESLRLDSSASGTTLYTLTGGYPYLTVTIIGSNHSGSMGDTVALTGDGSPIIVAAVANDQIAVAGGGLGLVTLFGIENLTLDAAGGAVTYVGNAEPNSVTVTPTAGDSAIVAQDGLDTAISLTGAGSLLVDLVGGSDTLTVVGTQGADGITVTPTQVAVNALLPVDYVGGTVEALRVLGLDGSDLFNLTPSVTTSIFLDGGNPIGVEPGDQIIVNGPAQVNPGSLPDEGSILAPGTLPVSFARIETITINGGGVLFITGTNGDDAITIIARDGSTHGGADGDQDFTVTINGGPEVLYLNVASIIVDARGGNDTIAIQTPAPNGVPWNVNVTVLGGLPSGSDTVIVGTPGTDTVTWTPNGADSGTLAITNLNSFINLVQVEHLIYDGEAGDDSFTIVGTGGDDTIVSTPGSAVDEGFLRVNNLLGVTYQNLGAGATLAVDGQGGNDTLVARGTDVDDVFTVDAAGNVALASHLTLTRTNFENLVLQGLDGDDVFNVDGAAAFTTLRIEGGNPSASDVLFLTGAVGVAETVTIQPNAVNPTEQSITGLGAPITTSGVEVIRYTGVGGDDDLRVVLGNGDDVARLDGGVTVDALTSSSLPRIEYGALNAFTLDAVSGIDTVTVNLSFLLGAANYNVSASISDTVIFEGAGDDDLWTVVNPVGANLFQITDNSLAHSGATVAVQGIPQHIVLQTMGGDDVVTIDIGVDGAIPLPLTFDGGLGSDTLIVQGDAGVDEVIYRTGPAVNEGRLTYEDFGNAVLMTIDFLNLEPVIDLVPAATLTVNGTNASNAFTYGEGAVAGRGLVSVDGFEGIEFANKTTLALNGLGGMDTFAVEQPAVNPTGLTTVIVNGGAGVADGFTFRGTLGNDAFTYTATALDSADLTANGILYNLRFVESAHIDALDVFPADNDTLTVTTVHATVIPGATPGTGEVKPVDMGGRALLGLTFTGIEDATVIGTIGVVQGWAGNDVITIDGTTGIVTVTDMFGFINEFDMSAFSAIVVNSLGGDDSITILSGPLFTGVAVPAVNPGIRILGGENGTGTDNLTVVGSAAADAINVNLQTNLITGIIGGGIHLDGVEVLNVNGAGGADAVTIDQFGETTDVQAIFVDGTGGDSLTVIGTVRPDVLNFNPFNATSGEITRNGTVTPITYSNMTGALEIQGGTGGFDVLNVLGTEGPDAITSTANTITRDGTVTVGAGINRTDVYGLAGNDTINLAAFNATPVRIYGGDGNDVITGTLQADEIYGGDGNDSILGLGGDDLIYGGDGNDTAVGGTGTDTFFGGAGSDVFVWNPGDGSDVFEGGAGDSDRLVFNGAAGAETFNLFASPNDPSRFHLFRQPGNVLIDSADVEAVDINTLGGIDTINIGRSDTGLLSDLSTTTVRSINLDLGNDGVGDTVTVEGRPVNDNILASISNNIIRVAGLGYDVLVRNHDVGVDRLVLTGNEGNDTITAEPGVTAAMLVTLQGDVGNDLLIGDAVSLIGGAGNDTLIGGAGNNFMDGGTGDNLFVGNGGTDAVVGGAGADTILVEGNNANNLINLSLNGAGHLVATVDGLTTTYTAAGGGAIAGAGIDLIDVHGLAGNDRLTVDSSNGALPIAINFDGGANADLVILTGGTADANVYGPGPNPGQGTSSITIAGVTQVVTFNNLEPVIDLVAGPLVINANNADNAINVGSLGANGLVSIDLLETIEFANKTTVTINALAGSDTINVNNPLGLTGNLIVNGGDPTGSDRLIVNGLAATTAVNLAAGSITGVAPAAVVYTGIEHLTAVAGASTTLALSGSADYIYTPGAAINAGDVQTDFIPVDFIGYGTGRTLSLDGTSATVYGTNGNDTVNVAANGNVNLNNRATIARVNLTTMTIDTLDGDDTFNVVGNHPYTTLNIHGNNPSASDVLNFTGTGGNLTVELGAQSIQEAGFGVVNFTGIERLNANATAANVLVNGTLDEDHVAVTPTTADNVTLTREGTNTVFSFTGVGATFTVDLQGAADGLDELTVNATQAADIIDVNMVPNVVAVGARQPITYANIDSLVVNGRGGDDTFNVTTSATVPIKIDGGDPIGSTAGDLLNLFPTAAFVLETGPEVDEGGLRSQALGVFQRVSWDHIEAVSINGPNGGVILGTNGNDAITIIARDNTTHAGTDGVQDFTVSVNAGPDILFVNVPTLDVDALAGNDTITVRAPAPAAVGPWNVQLRLNGGPSASAGLGQGDRFILETPGMNEVLYTPTAGSADSGTFTLVQAINSVITLGSIPGFSPGGFEYTQYDGLVGNDTFRIQTPINETTVTTFAMAASDAGLFTFLSAGTNLLPVYVGNLGGGGTIRLEDLGGAEPAPDRFIHRGTANNDTFNITTIPGVSMTVNAGIPIVIPIAAGVPTTELLTLDGLGGADTMVFTGQTGSEIYRFSNVESRFTMLRDLDLINGIDAINIQTMSVENATVNMQGGGDYAQINNLAGTDLQALTIDLGADAVQDVVGVEGSENPDDLRLGRTPADVLYVTGLTHSLNLLNSTGVDFIAIRGNGGDDTLRMDPNVAGLIQAQLQGGAGNDILSGPAILEGGTGNDMIDMSMLTNGVSFQLNAVGAAQIVPGMGVVILNQQAELFRGTPFADIIYVQPQATARSIDGFGGYDTLIIDTTGGTGVLTENVVFAGPQAAPVTFTNVSNIQFSGNTLVEVSSLIRLLSVGRPKFIKQKGIWKQRILLRNDSKKLRISGPFYAVLSNLPPRLKILNVNTAVAMRAYPAGSTVVPFNNPPDGNLAPGEMISIEITFRGRPSALRALRKMGGLKGTTFAGPGLV